MDMEDFMILDLYRKRSEQAIKETQKKYHNYCYNIAINILGVKEDADECVSDVYYTAWNQIPPDSPHSLRIYLGTITRNLSISRYRTNHAKKRHDGMTILLSELQGCIPSNNGVENQLEVHAIEEAINRWLGSLPSKDRALFVRRYWLGESIKYLSIQQGVPAGKLAQKMFRLRNSLKAALEKEGIPL